MVATLLAKGTALALALLAAGCSGGEPAAQGNANIVSFNQPVVVPRPPRPIFRRGAPAVARLVVHACLRATEESATVARFEAILRDFGQTPASIPATGRMTGWQVPGGDIFYANSPKGGFAASILCMVNLDPGGAPPAENVARALEQLLGRGPPRAGHGAGPGGLPGYRWEYSPRPGAQTVLSMGDMPQMCGDEGVGCSPAVLAIQVAHTIAHETE